MDVLTRLVKVKYLGSHPSVPGQTDRLTIEFRTDGVRIARKKGEGILVPWAQVERLEALDQQEIEEQVTATRVFLLGALALLATKRTTHSFLVVVDREGEWIFAVPALSSVELHSGLGPLRRYLRPGGTGTDTGTDTSMDTSTGSGSGGAVVSADRTIPERLAQLDQLLGSGAITQAERDDRRHRILDEI